MAINEVATGLVYNCDGATVLFPITYPYLEDANVEVIHLDGATNVSTTLVIGTDYTVANDEVQTVETYPIGDKIFLGLDMPLTQTVDLLEKGSISSEVLETALDRLTLIAQDISMTTDNVVALAFPESPSPSLTLGPKAERINSYVACDSNGDITLVKILDTGTIVVTAFGEALIGSADSSEARTILDVYSSSEVDAIESDLGGVGRTTETIKGNADDIATNISDLSDLAGAGRTTETVKDNADNITTNEQDVLAAARKAALLQLSTFRVPPGLSVSANPQIFYDGGGYVAAWNTPGTTRSILSTDDGYTWTETTMGLASADTPGGIAYSPDLGLWLVTVDNATTTEVYTASTPDGTWSLAQTLAGSNVNALDVEWIPDLDIFAHVRYNLTDSEWEIWTSPDSTTWTKRYNDGTYASGGSTAPAYSPSLGVAVVGTNGAMVYSTNGTSWTAVATPNYVAQQIVWAEDLGLFVVAGTDSVGTNHILTSTNGTSWTGRSPYKDNGLSTVTWNEEAQLLVVYGFNTDEDMMQGSTDGINWYPVGTDLLQLGNGELTYSPTFGAYFKSELNNMHSTAIGKIKE